MTYVDYPEMTLVDDRGRRNLVDDLDMTRARWNAEMTRVDDIG